MNKAKIKTKVKDWWAQNPMTYGETHGKSFFDSKSYEMGTKEFFDRLDREFYSWNRPLHKNSPFDQLFPYKNFKKSRVLEVGCGMGTMLMNWAEKGAQCSAVDLNPTSICQTKKRFKIHNLKGNILLSDANNLPFKDNEFDYVYSWGVLHHSPNLELSIQELFRVLKPGGEFGVMLYNRKSLYQFYMTDFIEGFLHNERKFLSSLELNSRYGDGHREEGNPYTWPITKKEGLKLIGPHSHNCSIKVLGTDLDSVLQWMLPGLSPLIPLGVVKALARRLGWSLWFHGNKD